MMTRFHMVVWFIVMRALEIILQVAKLVLFQFLRQFAFIR